MENLKLKLNGIEIDYDEFDEMIYTYRIMKDDKVYFGYDNLDDVNDYCDFVVHVEKNLSKLLSKPDLKEAPVIVQDLYTYYQDCMMTFIEDDDYMDFIQPYTDEEIDEGDLYLTQINSDLGGNVIDGDLKNRKDFKYYLENVESDGEPFITCYGNFKTYFNEIYTKEC